MIQTSQVLAKNAFVEKVMQLKTKEELVAFSTDMGLVNFNNTWNSLNKDAYGQILKQIRILKPEPPPAFDSLKSENANLKLEIESLKTKVNQNSLQSNDNEGLK